MKKDNLVSISGIENGNNPLTDGTEDSKNRSIKIKIKRKTQNNRGSINRWSSIIIILLLVFSIPAIAASAVEDISRYKTFTVEGVYFKYDGKIDAAENSPYGKLLQLQKGALFDYRKIRKTMEDLFKTGTFDNIEIKLMEKPGQKVEIYFLLTGKYTIEKIVINELYKQVSQPNLITMAGFKKKDLEKAIYSMRERDLLDESKITSAIKDIINFFNSRGFFSPEVTYEIDRNPAKSTCIVNFNISPGGWTRIENLEITIVGNQQQYLPQVKRMLAQTYYIPILFNKNVEKVNNMLKKQNFFLPDIKIKENFLDPLKSKVNLSVTVDPGFRYVIVFKGMSPKPKLVSAIWEKRVFEIWAEKESRERILLYLKNKGYLNAQVTSAITEVPEKSEKIITFTVTTDKKYKLGKTTFEGNRVFTGEQLGSIIQIDKQPYNKRKHLRFASLTRDRDLLHYFYYSRGYTSVRIGIQQDFHDNTVDIRYVIDEGKKYTVEKLSFDGIHFYTSDKLTSFMQTKSGGPFILQKLTEDIERLKLVYIANGYDKVDINPEISPGENKSITIHVKEGKAYRMGNLIVSGGTSLQNSLVHRLFPLKMNDAFNRLRINDFQRDIESTSIFNQFKVIDIERETGVIDVLITVNGDYSTFYGFGIGWAERQGVRGTIEYQGRNVFKGYSNMSLMLQLGLQEQSGVISYDTPFFFKTRVSSSFKLWADNENYPSYQFYRFGIGESFIKKFNPYSYMVGTISWYRTTLTSLDITPGGFDQVDKPFDTTAVDFSYVNEKRDDPFNPTKGTFFSTDLKVGLPLDRKNVATANAGDDEKRIKTNSFLKVRWNFQKNFPLFRTGAFSASMRTGLAIGDMSITERFFAGGYNSFRAARKDWLGPIDSRVVKDTTVYHPRGGNALLLFNFETTFPVPFINFKDLYYSIFFDIGNVYDKIKDIDLKRLQTGAGISLKYRTPMGPIRFDLAWDLKTRKPEIQIGIGNVF